MPRQISGVEDWEAGRVARSSHNPTRNASRSFCPTTRREPPPAANSRGNHASSEFCQRVRDRRHISMPVPAIPTAETRTSISTHQDCFLHKPELMDAPRKLPTRNSTTARTLRCFLLIISPVFVEHSRDSQQSAPFRSRNGQPT